MADITDPQAIKFANEVVRPLCEQVRAIKARIDDAMIAWFGGLNSVIGSSADDNLIDGREIEGISQLTGDDITGVMSVLSGLQSDLDQAGVPQRIQKPCVRPLSAE